MATTNQSGDNQQTPTSPDIINRRLKAIKNGDTDLSDPKTTTDIVCSGTDATKLVRASSPGASVVWAGRVLDDWVLESDDPHAPLLVNDLTVFGQIHGDLTVVAVIEGDLNLASESIGRVVIGNIDGTAVIRRDLTVWPTARVSSLQVTSKVGRNIEVMGPIDGGVMIWPNVGNDLIAKGAVKQSIVIQPGIVRGNVDIGGAIDNGVTLRASVGGDALLSAEVLGTVSIHSRIAGDLVVGPGHIA